MIQDLSFFQTASALSRHAGHRQAVVSQNIAHADTPGYRAKRLAAFDDVYRDQDQMGVRRTRASHLGNDGIEGQVSPHESRAGVDLNGNSVSLEEEMIRAADARSEQDRALALYRHGLKVMRLALGRRA